MEAPAEHVLAIVVLPTATGDGVPLDHVHLRCVRPDPSGEQGRIGVGPQQLGRRGPEVAGDADDRNAGIGLDGGVIDVDFGVEVAAWNGAYIIIPAKDMGTGLEILKRYTTA